MACPTCDVEYRRVVGFGGPGYRVGDDGSVWTRLRGRWGMSAAWSPLTPVVCKRRGRYLKVTLCHNGDRVQRYVHELVLTTFVGPCPEGLECRHLDGDPQNNRLGNLLWGTRLENADDLRRHGRHYTPFKRPSKLSPEQRQILRQRHSAGESARAMAPEFGVAHSTISRIVGKKDVYSGD